uniref:RING-type domain-containing protein n=2 Tax=Davidia involucrata TaxID=16924 RepID=A0A5B7A2A7_DAVIN
MLQPSLHGKVSFLIISPVNVIQLTNLVRVRVRTARPMEASGGNSDAYRGSSAISNSRRYGMQLYASNFFRSPLSTLLEYSGILRSRSSHPESDSLINSGVSVGFRDHIQNDTVVASGNGGEVSIRIIGASEHEQDRVGIVLPSSTVAQNDVFVQPMARTASTTSVSSALDGQGDSRSDRGAGEGVSQPLNGGVDGEAVDGVNNRDSSYQRYDIQQAARWMEQVLPFSLLLLVVFIRQHLQGFFVTIWIAAVMFKSNDILQKQTALKGERKLSVLIGISLVFMLHVVGVYWWYRNDDLLYPLIMVPPKAIPPFWHAIFIIIVNDTLVRQAAMVLKCILLMYYKNTRGRNYRKQGQMLTLVEYLLLLYRAFLPGPVWYRFFLNKEYGSLFSSLMAGLYLTFKLTSVVEKGQSLYAAIKALSRKEIHYGAYATSEQINAAGDLCAICQEKMHAPILLRCKHLFCEDCVSEWFERERTCPLCRALVKPADLRSFGDGSTSLFCQLF